MLENNVDTIKKEFYSSNTEAVEHAGNKLLSESGLWSSITLIGPKGINVNCIKNFPKTIELLKKMPICETFGFVNFSKLSQKLILKHITDLVIFDLDIT